MFDVQKLVNNAVNLARPNRFLVSVIGKEGVENTTPEMSLNCFAASFPMVGFTTSDTQITFDLPSKQPSWVNFYEISLSFYVSEDYKEWNFFNQWQAKIYNSLTNTFGFSSDYTRTIEIVQYNQKEEIIQGVRLLEAYPQTVNAVDLSYQKTDAITEFTSVIYYKNFEILSPKNGLNIYREALITSHTLWDAPAPVPEPIVERKEDIIWMTPETKKDIVDSTNTKNEPVVLTA